MASTVYETEICVGVRASDQKNAVRTDSVGGGGASRGKPVRGVKECHLFSAGFIRKKRLICYGCYSFFFCLLLEDGKLYLCCMTAFKARQLNMLKCILRLWRLVFSVCLLNLLGLVKCLVEFPLRLSVKTGKTTAEK